jgi:hypothetical protein
MDIPVAGYVTANVPARIPVQNSNFTLNGTFLPRMMEPTQYATRSYTKSQEPVKKPEAGNRYTNHQKRYWLQEYQKSGLSPEKFVKLRKAQAAANGGVLPPSPKAIRGYVKRVGLGLHISGKTGAPTVIDDIGIELVKQQVQAYIMMDEAR